MFSSDNSIRTSCLPPAIVKRVRRDAITFLFRKLPSNRSVTFTIILAVTSVYLN